MLTIRLSRTGKKKAPSYRLVLQENHRDPWSPAIEVLGTYNPRSEKDRVVLKEDRIKYWLGQGVKPSNTVFNMLLDAKLIEGEKLNVVTITKKRAKKLGDKIEADKAKAEEAKAKAAQAKVDAEAAEAQAKADAEAAEVEAKAQAEAEAKAKAEEAKVEEAPATETPTPETTETPADEVKAEEAPATEPAS